jgi:hypothetical protein
MRVSANSADKIRVKSFLHSTFVRYGAGPDIFAPLTRLKSWNVIAWTTIAVGGLAWVVALVVWNS